MDDLEAEYYGGEDDFDLTTEYYVEKATNLIYEARLFDGFVLVRPASPAFYLALRKLSHDDFVKEFTEYLGDTESLRVKVFTGGVDLVIESI